MTGTTDALRQDILSGRFEPGDRLLELPLAEEYGCGRAAIRSAIVALTAEGLVLHETNRGATVRRITVDEAIQITEARSALEALIAEAAARNANDSDRENLASIIEDMRRAVSAHAGEDYSALNRLLHEQLRVISGHTIAAELVDNLRNRAAHHQYRLSVMPGRPSVSLEQHAAIVDAVISGNAEAARHAMVEHLSSVIDVLQSWGDVRSPG